MKNTTLICKLAVALVPLSAVLALAEGPNPCGAKLGAGNEATVYELNGYPDRVVRVPHEPIPPSAIDEFIERARILERVGGPKFHGVIDTPSGKGFVLERLHIDVDRAFPQFGMPREAYDSALDVLDELIRNGRVDPDLQLVKTIDGRYVPVDGGMMERFRSLEDALDRRRRYFEDWAAMVDGDDMPPLRAFAPPEPPTHSAAVDVGLGLTPRVPSFGGRLATTGTIVGGQLPLAEFLSKGGFAAFLGTMFIWDLVEEHPDSLLSQSLPYIGQAVHEADRCVTGGALGYAGAITESAGRGLSNIVTLAVEGRKGAVAIWDAQSRHERGNAPSIGAARPWYSYPADTWGRRMWRAIRHW